MAKILAIQDGTTVSVRHAPRNQQLSRDEHPQWMHPADLLIGCLGQQEMPGLNRRALGAFLGFSVHGFQRFIRVIAAQEGKISLNDH